MLGKAYIIKIVILLIVTLGSIQISATDPNNIELASDALKPANKNNIEDAHNAESCNQDNPKNCYKLGLVYLDKKDYLKANEFFKKSCDAKIMDGCNMVGHFYYQGWGVNQSYASASGFFQTACEGNISEACHNLAFLYRMGWGVKKDHLRAISYYDKACNMGREQSCELSKRLKEKGG